jgi:predicted deacylase
VPTRPRQTSTSKISSRPKDDGLSIGGMFISRGEQKRIEIPITMLATQGALTMPVEVIVGDEPGPVLALTSTVHGDELNGIEIIRQLIPLLSPNMITGALVAIPIVNVPAFLNQSRYLPDRRDLNRVFPGSKNGSQASRIAFALMEQVIKQCSHLIDIHSASAHRSNSPQIRASLSSPEIVELAKAFGAPFIIHAAERDGSLRMAAAGCGITSMVYEAGDASRFDKDAIETGLHGVLGVMHHLDMVSARDVHIRKTKKVRHEHSRIFDKHKWVRATRGGLFRAHVAPGQDVERDQFLGFIADAFGEGMAVVRSPKSGVIVGITRNPVVGHGDALVNIAH